MKLRLVIVDLEMSPRVKRLLVRVGIPIAVVLGGSAFAYANVPKVWNSGDKLLAADLNGNFSALDARITALEGGRLVGVVNGKKYSVGATVFVMETPSAYDGSAVGGYQGAKAKCEAATGSPSAHMCTNEEIVRSAALGIAGPGTVGWYAVDYQADVGTSHATDCLVYTSNDSVGYGPITRAGASWAPSLSTCNVANPILCCD